MRAWSWLHAKYSTNASKRLVLSETVSLGEKRFVALVSVEGREFLIGGSGSNVSLLAKLRTTPESANDRQQNADVEEIA
jgi:flagellar biogenesis protein FliO